jgi:hypothetical protein
MAIITNVLLQGRGFDQIRSETYSDFFFESDLLKNWKCLKISMMTN